MLSELRTRATARRREKLMMTVALPLYFCVLYFALQRWLIVPPRTLTPLFLDHWIGFSPQWTAVYQSLYLFLPLPWLCTSAIDLRRYRYGFFGMTLAAFACFLVVPVAGPRPEVVPDHSLYQFLIRYDANLNAFPSLHVALTVSTLLLALRLTGNRVVSAVAILWGCLIIYSTMAIKQHWAVDAAAGLLLAFAADALARSLTNEEKENFACADSSLDPSS